MPYNHGLKKPAFSYHWLFQTNKQGVEDTEFSMGKEEIACRISEGVFFA